MSTTHGGRDVVADHRRRPGHRQRPRRSAGASTARGAHRFIALRQDDRPDALDQRARRAGRPTRSTRPRSSPTSTARGCSSRAAATAPSTRSRSRPASRSGAGDVSKRGLNTAALMIGTDVIVTHSEENLDIERDGHDRGRPDGIEGHADRQGRALARARRAGRLRVAGRRRRAHLPRRQRRHAVRLRRRRPASSSGRKNARHDPEGVAGARRRQALRRHRERQVLHPQAARRRRRDPRRGRCRSARDGRAPRRSSPSPAVARGRVYVVVDGRVYAIGPKSTPTARPAAPRRPTPAAVAAGRRAGGAARLADRADPQAGRGGRAARVRAFDASGSSGREAPAQATWTLEG